MCPPLLYATMGVEYVELEGEGLNREEYKDEKGGYGARQITNLVISASP